MIIVSFADVESEMNTLNLPGVVVISTMLEVSTKFLAYATAYVTESFVKTESYRFLENCTEGDTSSFEEAVSDRVLK